MSRWLALSIVGSICVSAVGCVKMTHAQFTDGQALAWCGLVLAYIFTILISGYSPFYWLAKFCMKAEAHQQHLMTIIGEASKEYRERYRETEAEVKKAAVVEGK